MSKPRVFEFRTVQGDGQDGFMNRFRGLMLAARMSIRPGLWRVTIEKVKE